MNKDILITLFLGICVTVVANGKDSVKKDSSPIFPEWKSRSEVTGLYKCELRPMVAEAMQKRTYYIDAGSQTGSLFEVGTITSIPATVVYAKDDKPENESLCYKFANESICFHHDGAISALSGKLFCEKSNEGLD